MTFGLSLRWREVTHNAWLSPNVMSAIQNEQLRTSWLSFNPTQHKWGEGCSLRHTEENEDSKE